ncbi:MAG: glycoside hydrolase family 3 C-terminal domain-containing protein [Anaerolineales bacterium]|nr:glycoside hydrolase family 3 C-terminal domain-containing protein [Anaerolineales bacterium]MDW8279072.1 glycoside hydrolase family 3 N-terminal domain-containing protein [Anaerolineales bacterium]
MRFLLSRLAALSLLLVSCAAPTPTAAPTLPPTSTTAPSPAPSPTVLPPYRDPSLPVEARIDDLLARMTLEDKLGQMTQVEKGAMKLGDVAPYRIGSVLSGGGGSPLQNDPAGWVRMTGNFQQRALETPLQIPVLYGVDAVHGHNNLLNATIFPHNIGLGAANDPDLARRIARATAIEMMATGIPWNFAPTIAVPQDIRWGRTYEGFSENTEIVTRLGAAYIEGLQAFPDGYVPAPGQTLFVAATPKHFLGDGGTLWETSKTPGYRLDQGDMQMDDAAVRALFLPPYRAAVQSGALVVMASYSSWNGVKMHAHRYLLTDVLKGELGFRGLVVSDWQAVDQIYPGDLYRSIVTAINAGVDMVMVPTDYLTFLRHLRAAVERGDIPPERIDDAVRRILRVKFALGLFERPAPLGQEETLAAFQARIRSPEHLALAREAVRKSLVLLKNEGQTLPLDKNTPLIFVAGEGAVNLARQTGGWTVDWQGKEGFRTAGTTLLQALQAAIGPQTRVVFDKTGQFAAEKDENGQPLKADVGLVVLAEFPYAEGAGDSASLTLPNEDLQALRALRERADRVVVVIFSGRPVIITDLLPLAEAWVAAWLPGSEGAGVTDVLFGDAPFTGKLPYTWPRRVEQLPMNIHNAAGKTGCDGPLFPFGYGLTTEELSPVILECD